MRRSTKILSWVLSAVSYAVFLSLGFYSFLYALSIAIVPFSGGLSHYPRFYPFCLAVCLFSTVMLIVTGVLNFLYSEKLNFKNVTWILQWFVSLAVSVPMVHVWTIVFNFLQDTF